MNALYVLGGVLIGAGVVATLMSPIMGWPLATIAGVVLVAIATGVEYNKE